jgi:hypothetical protein
MNYTPEQFTQAVLKALQELNGPDLSKLSFNEKKELANNPNTQAEVLITLAKDENWGVRRRVADNPNTPPEALISLAKDEYWCVRNAVENNPNYKPSKEITLTYEQREALKSLLASSQDENLKSIQF